MAMIQFKFSLLLSLIGISLEQFGYGGNGEYGGYGGYGGYGVYGGNGMDPFGWGRGASAGAGNSQARQLGMFSASYGPIGIPGYGLPPPRIYGGYGYGFDVWGRKAGSTTMDECFTILGLQQYCEKQRSGKI